MGKRYLVMQAHVHKPGKHAVEGQWMSEKLDGMRIFWDGGISTNKPARHSQWANVAKDKKEVIATGLWSRQGKVVHAPQWWLDKLPSFPLDGELYIDRGQFQRTMSYARKHTPVDSEWNQLLFMVFDSPNLSSIFYPSTIDQTNYCVYMPDPLLFLPSYLHNHLPKNYAFKSTWDFLQAADITNDTVQLVEQIPVESKQQVEEFSKQVLLRGGEGVILRNPLAMYIPERVHSMTKLKPRLDDEAVVMGYISGRATAKGGKYRGMLGALVVTWKGKKFKLSGLTDHERTLVDTRHEDVLEATSHAFNYAYHHPEETMPYYISSRHFPPGTKVTFTYRELSSDGIPKEAAYLRPYTEVV